MIKAKGLTKYYGSLAAVEDVTFQVKKEAVRDLLWEVSVLKAEKFLAEPANLRTYDLGKPTIKITVELQGARPADKREKKVFLLGKQKDKDSYYARIEPAQLTFLLSKETLNKLEEKISSLKPSPKDENPRKIQEDRPRPGEPEPLK